MANSLRRDIEKWEILVVKKSLVSEAYKDVWKRLFVADSGFGMTHSLRGYGVFGFEARIERGVIVLEKYIKRDGNDFDAAETKRWQNATRIHTLDKLKEFRNESGSEVKFTEEN